MLDNFSLTGPFAQGDRSKKVKNIVVMLHGYGSNGYDLIRIAHDWKEQFPNIFFSAPNAPYKFDSSPGVFKWFEVFPEGIPIDQASDEQKQIIKENFFTSCNLIEKHIYSLSSKHKISLNKIFLLGFSQGSMMSIEVGTKLKKPIAGVLSLSGRIFFENFENINRNKIPILIIHGEDDQVIPVHRYKETCEILKKNNYHIKNYLIKNLEHSINNEVIEISENFIKSYK